MPSNRTIGDTDGPFLRKNKETQIVSDSMDVEVKGVIMDVRLCCRIPCCN
jgi:hypothetical protein